MKYLFLFSLLIFACGKSPEETTQNLSTQNYNLSTYGDTLFIVPSLPDNVRAEVIQWGAFEDFEEQAKTINGITLEMLKNKSNRMVSHIDSILKKIPDTLNTPIIYSRLLVVKTRTHLLNQEARKVHLDSISLEKKLIDLNISVKNLFVQINEKLEKDQIDLQRNNNEKIEIESQK